MFSNAEILERIAKIAEEDKRYEKEAFLFVLVALEYTISKLKVRRHLTGAELAKGIAGFAREQYGYMARTVLENWGITITMDFGEIVYLLIEHGLLTKTDTDKKEDFAEVYDFRVEFDWKRMRSPDFPDRL